MMPGISSTARPVTVIARRTPRFNLEGLEELVGTGAIDRLRHLAWQFKRVFHNGHGLATVWHVNSSGFGGGVADILSHQVPLCTRLGIPTNWIVIGGDDSFYQITKAFHNALQGNPQVVLTDDMLDYYWETLAANAVELEKLFGKRGWCEPAVIVIHDPQPAGLIHALRRRFPSARFIWRGHLQFDVTSRSRSHPGRKAWEFLVPLLNEYDAAIFHLPEMVPDGLRIPVRFILPSINPFGYLNRDLSSPAGQKFIHSTLAQYRLEELHDPGVPLILQNARFDPWKDPVGVIQAYREARERLSGADQRLPYLLLLGPLAEDDPEAIAVLGQVKKAASRDGMIRPLALSPTDQRLTGGQKRALMELGFDLTELQAHEILELKINAFQTRADIVVAKSTSEGFGLTITGAGYHGKPRIVSEVGGIPAQVIDALGRANACLVGGRPFTREASIAMTAEWIVKLLADAEGRRELGERARQHVIQSFLPHRHLEDYLSLFLELQVPSREPQRARYATGQLVSEF